MKRRAPLLFALAGAMTLSGCAGGDRVTLLEPAQAAKKANNEIGAVAVLASDAEDADDLEVLELTNEQARLSRREGGAPRIRQLNELDPAVGELFAFLPAPIARQSFSFAIGRDDLTEEVLTSLQAWLGANIVGRPGLQIEIAAFADATGTEAINDTITLGRARNVRQQVISRIERDSLEINVADIDTVASSWHAARREAQLEPGQVGVADDRWRVVWVTVR
jgi:outer membrane protein OmpA-like peptidoglycan-associated protein